MEIVVDLLALDTDLKAVKFSNYLDSNYFNRQLTTLGLQSNWATAHKQRSEQKKSKGSSWPFDFGSGHEELLIYFLNDLYETRRAEFCGILCSLLAEFISRNTEYLVIDAILADLDILGVTPEQREKLVEVWRRHDNNVLLKVRNLENLLISVGRGLKDDVRYGQLLEPLLAIPDVKKLLPEIVVANQRIAAYWPAIQKMGGYKDRDTFIHQAFRPLIEQLQKTQAVMASSVEITDHHINEQWQKALDRVQRDPEGAITMARTLLETVCRHILDSLGQPHDYNGDVIRLYKTVARVLNLSPDQHTATNFKQILSGASAIVDGLAGLRNNLGDAHGKTHSSGRPATRHAQLAVNMSGAMSHFLLQTFESRIPQPAAGGDDPKAAP